ncbi:RNA-binding ATPase activator esf2 [Malassezia yamatoensis]|uniref:18S rRNA factor 2 n=1 Tax=Malassezia yamatoensis TaxID=253288 RepID=A0AAJ5YYS4_9BASI|nr:RNA-binding ATPase activator esf2 [Malassezia yamatoensis]
MVGKAPVRDARFDLAQFELSNRVQNPDKKPKKSKKHVETAKMQKSNKDSRKAARKELLERGEDDSEHEQHLHDEAEQEKSRRNEHMDQENRTRSEGEVENDHSDESRSYSDDEQDKENVLSDISNGSSIDEQHDTNETGDDLHSTLMSVPERSSERVITPESLEAYTQKQQKTGIIYVSRIPPGMTAAKIRHIFSQFGEVGRIYLQPKSQEKSAARKRKRSAANFGEGWVEYLSKSVAKTAAEMMNAQPIGSLAASAHSSRRSQKGSKVANRWKDDIWTMKYLKGFRWPMLIEQMSHEKAAHAARMRMELVQSAHEQRDYLKKVERSRIQREKDAKRLKRGIPQEEAPVEFEFHQRTPVYRDVRDQRAMQSAPNAKSNASMDHVLDQIL